MELTNLIKSFKNLTRNRINQKSLTLTAEFLEATHRSKNSQGHLTKEIKIKPLKISQEKRKIRSPKLIKNHKIKRRQLF